MSAQWLYLEDNGLLWLFGNLEKKQVEKNARAKKMDKDGVERSVRAKVKKEEGKDKDGVEITISAKE